MTYYTVSTVYDIIKALLGYPKSGNSVKMVPHPAVTTSPQSIARSLVPSTAEVPPNLDGLHNDWQSVQSVSSTSSSVKGNSSSRRHGNAIFRGSPKALGWTIDETEEENAWVLLMHDAMHGSVYDVNADEDDITSPPIAPSNHDITRFLASKEQPGVSYVWRIIPSLSGAHQWTLHREADPTSVMTNPEIVHAEVQVDTNDLVLDTHQEVEVQTIIKTYSDAGVQVEEPEPAVPIGALSPLPESTELVDVLPADLRPVTPGEVEPTLIDSRPGTPNSQSRIPRLISRQESLASFKSENSTRSSSPVPRGASPTPTPATQKLVSRATNSIRSMALRRASSKASMNLASTATEAKDVEVLQADKKKAGGRLFDAVKKIGRTDSTLKALKA